MPYDITRRFESALCEYTGAKYAVAVNSCTAALLLAVEWYGYKEINDAKANGAGMIPLLKPVTIPKNTYVSVPQAIIRAGRKVFFDDRKWKGSYRLTPLPVFDAARMFTSGMMAFMDGAMMCVSFAASKILGAEQGGAILHDNRDADAWFRRMRFDGRTEGVDPLEDTFDLIGHHCLMIPSVAATLLVRLHHLPKHNADLGPYEYPDLSKHPAFK